MSVEDLLRATTEAVTASMRPVRPLNLRPDTASAQAPAKRRRDRQPRHWSGWLVPLAAAVAVILVAVTLVTARTMPGPARPGAGQSGAATSGAAAALDQVPAYYAAITKPTKAAAPYDVTIAETATGKALFTLKPPKGASFTQVTKADDDRTFVVSVAPFTGGASLMRATLGWDLVRVNSDATGYSQRMLPVPALPGSAFLQGFALSPDGAELAVMFNEDIPGAGTDVTLRIYSVATGHALRAWQSGNTALWAGFSPSNDNDTIRWLTNGHELAFVWSAEKATGPRSGTVVPEVRRVDLAKPGAGLIADSALVTLFSEPGGCDTVQPTADGDGALCGTGPQFALGNGASCSSVVLPMGFYAYSGVPATYRLLYAIPVPKQLTGKCFSGNADVLWASPSASVMVAMVSVPGSHGDTNVIGVISHGRWTQLPASVLHLGQEPDNTAFAF